MIVLTRPRASTAFLTFGLLVGLLAPSASAGTVLCNGQPATIVGTDAAEVLQGTAGPDRIAALGGDDQVIGGGSNDVICGGEGNDILLGLEGADTLLGEGGDVDVMEGGVGNDAVSGGAGIADVSSYLSSAAPVTASLVTDAATGQGSDTLFELEGFVGSSFADSLTGDGSGFNSFTGAGGSDTIVGRGGLDAILFTSGVTSGVTVDLAGGSATGEGTDSLTSVEAAVGTSFLDILKGNGANNTFLAGPGNDEISGAGGTDQFFGEAGADRLRGEAGDDILRGGTGNDTITGGAGAFDMASFFDASGAVTASLAAGTATGIGNDSLASVEGLVGSRFGDSLSGNGSPNRLYGVDGSDQLRGFGGNDLLDGGGSPDTVNGGSGRDYCIGETRAECEDGPSDPARSAAPTSPPPASPPGGAIKSPGTTGPVEQPSREAVGAAINVLRSRASGETVERGTTVTIRLWDEIQAPVDCYQADSLTIMPSYRQAEGDVWYAYLWYWDGNEWIYSDASIGPLYRWSFYQFIVPAAPAYMTTWVFGNGAVAPSQSGFNVNTSVSHYWAWTEFATYGDGSTVSNVNFTHQNVTAAATSYYEDWCYMP